MDLRRIGDRAHVFALGSFHASEKVEFGYSRRRMGTSRSPKAGSSQARATSRAPLNRPIFVSKKIEHLVDRVAGDDALRATLFSFGREIEASRHYCLPSDGQGGFSVEVVFEQIGVDCEVRLGHAGPHFFGIEADTRYRHGRPDAVGRSITKVSEGSIVNLVDKSHFPRRIPGRRV